jgi:hypothetical protein
MLAMHLLELAITMPTGLGHAIIVGCGIIGVIININNDYYWLRHLHQLVGPLALGAAWFWFSQPLLATTMYLSTLQPSLLSFQCD